jgi:hypothetical protein
MVTPPDKLRAAPWTIAGFPRIHRTRQQVTHLAGNKPRLRGRYRPTLHRHCPSMKNIFHHEDHEEREGKELNRLNLRVLRALL